MCSELRCCQDDDTCSCLPARDAVPLRGQGGPVYQYAKHLWYVVHTRRTLTKFRKNETEGEHANLVFDVLHEHDNHAVIYREIYEWATSPEGEAAGGFAAIIAPFLDSFPIDTVEDFNMIKDDGQEARICDGCCERVIKVRTR
jgi:hypothetical protein